MDNHTKDLYSLYILVLSMEVVFQKEHYNIGSFIYQLIYKYIMQIQLLKNKYERSPTLDTVLMVEKAIEKSSGEFNRRQLWKNLPKKVMWQTYLVVLDYLMNTSKTEVLFTCLTFITRTSSDLLSKKDRRF